MLGKIEAFMSGRLGLGILWILSLVATYHFSQSVEKDKNNAVESAVSSVAVQASKQLEASINNQVGSINARLTGDKHATDFLLSGQLADIKAAADRLANLPAAGVWVKAGTAATGKNQSAGAATGGPGNNETYRAELSDETRAFFTGESKRADECAVRLTGAQATIVSWWRAVEDYNRAIAQPHGVPPVVLPDMQRK